MITISDLTVTFTELPHNELLEIKLTENQHKFLYNKELDGVKFKDLVDADFIKEVKGMIDVLPRETLCLMGDWDVRLYRGVLRKFRAEHDTNELTLEDIEIDVVDELAKSVDFIKLEKAMASLPKQIEKTVKAYKATRAKLAKAYAKITDRELKAVSFGRATSLYKLRAEVVDYLNSK